MKQLLNPEIVFRFDTIMGPTCFIKPIYNWNWDFLSILVHRRIGLLFHTIAKAFVRWINVTILMRFCCYGCSFYNCYEIVIISKLKFLNCVDLLLFFSIIFQKKKNLVHLKIKHKKKKIINFHQSFFVQFNFYCFSSFFHVLFIENEKQRN